MIMHSLQQTIMAILKLAFYIFLLGFFHFAATEAQIYLYTNCTAHNNFTTKSAYEVNLKTLLSSISSNATGTTEFYDSTVGGNTSDAVHGLFMCRGDVSHQLCHACVANATIFIASNCSYSKEAIIWYDECMVRYSNRSFSSTVDERPRYGLHNVGLAPNQAKFSRILQKTLSDAVAEAVNTTGPDGSKKFATNEASISQTEKVYSLVQCTPDLSAQKCNSCLRDAIGDIPWCCAGNQGGRVLYPSCNFRFEMYRFYWDWSPEAPNPAPTATHVDTGSVATGKCEGNRISPSLTVAAVVVAIFVLLLGFGLGCYLSQRRMRKIYETNEGKQ